MCCFACLCGWLGRILGFWPWLGSSRTFCNFGFMESVMCNFSFDANLDALGRAFCNEQFPCFDPIHLNLSWPISSPKARFWNFPLNFGLACNFPEIYTKTSLTLIDPHWLSLFSWCWNLFFLSSLHLVAPIKLRWHCIWISRFPRPSSSSSTLSYSSSLFFHCISINTNCKLPLPNPFFPCLESARGSSNGCMHIYIVGALQSSCLN